MSKGYFLVFLTAVISGFAIFINKFGVSVINPFIFTWLKSLTVILILTGLFFMIKDWKILKNLTSKQWLLLAVIGLVGGSIPFLLFFKGLSLTSAAQGSFLHKTMFIYVALLAAVFLKEKIDKRFLFGGLFLFLGCLFLLKKLSFTLGQGDLLILLAALFWATENIISKYTLKDLQGRTVAWGRMFFGAFFIFLFLLGTGQVSLAATLNFTQISWVFVTAIFLFGYVMTWYTGLKHIPVHQAAVILLLGSPITTMLSFVSGKGVTLNEVLAGFFIIIGVTLALGTRQILKLFKETKDMIYAGT